MADRSSSAAIKSESQRHLKQVEAALEEKLHEEIRLVRLSVNREMSTLRESLEAAREEHRASQASVNEGEFEDIRLAVSEVHSALHQVVEAREKVDAMHGVSTEEFLALVGEVERLKEHARDARRVFDETSTLASALSSANEINNSMHDVLQARRAEDSLRSDLVEEMSRFRREFTEERARVDGLFRSLYEHDSELPARMKDLELKLSEVLSHFEADGRDREIMLPECEVERCSLSEQKGTLLPSSPNDVQNFFPEASWTEGSEGSSEFTDVPESKQLVQFHWTLLEQLEVLQRAFQTAVEKLAEVEADFQSIGVMRERMETLEQNVLVSCETVDEGFPVLFYRIDALEKARGQTSNAPGQGNAEAEVAEVRQQLSELNSFVHCLAERDLQSLRHELELLRAGQRAVVGSQVPSVQNVGGEAGVLSGVQHLHSEVDENCSRVDGVVNISLPRCLSETGDLLVAVQQQLSGLPRRVRCETASLTEGSGKQTDVVRQERCALAGSKHELSALMGESCFSLPNIPRNIKLGDNDVPPRLQEEPPNPIVMLGEPISETSRRFFKKTFPEAGDENSDITCQWKASNVTCMQPWEAFAGDPLKPDGFPHRLHLCDMQDFHEASWKHCLEDPQLLPSEETTTDSQSTPWQPVPQLQQLHKLHQLQQQQQQQQSVHLHKVAEPCACEADLDGSSLLFDAQGPYVDESCQENQFARKETLLRLSDEIDAALTQAQAVAGRAAVRGR